MTIFGSLYSDYYDIMYKNKNYRAEVGFYNSLIKKFGPTKSRKLISLGSGTLNHEMILSKMGYDLTCVEISKEMVKKAKGKIKKNGVQNINIINGDMTKVKFVDKFDVALSMFNVVSYCGGIKDLEKIFKSMSKSIIPGGVLIFDCWNILSVMKNPPLSPWAKYSYKDKTLYRLTSSSLDSKNKKIIRNVEMIELNKSKVIRKESESHILSAWSIEDVRRSLKKFGFEISHSCVFMDFDKPVNEDDWNMVIVAKKYENE